MKISEYFKLSDYQRILDFVDIKIDGDTELFLDPILISRKKHGIAEEAAFSIQTFFDTLLGYLKDRKVEQAEILMSHLREVNEVHLGYSEKRSQGRGIGEKTVPILIDSISMGKAVETGLIEDIEDMRIFLDGISKDMISDLCANIIRKQLLDYTISQCRVMGFPLTPNKSSGIFWNSDTREWEEIFCERLIINGDPILLTPKALVSLSESFSPNEYYQHYVLNYYQNLHLSLESVLVQVTRDKKGNIIRKFVTKKSIKKDFKDKGFTINKNWLAEFSKNNKTIYEKFKAEVIRESDDPSDPNVSEEDMAVLIDVMMNYLKTIKPGQQEAHVYHDVIRGICTLLFYPELSNPQKEHEINDGRKRIDLTFSNRAESGIFFRLSQAYDVPCQLIMIECKNYTKEIANPEIDQITGRFSANRGKFGIIFCRNLDNEALFVQREKDIYRDNHQIVIHITDNILMRMLVNYRTNPKSSFEEIISKLVDDVMAG